MFFVNFAISRENPENANFPGCAKLAKIAKIGNFIFYGRILIFNKNKIFAKNEKCPKFAKFDTPGKKISEKCPKFAKILQNFAKFCKNL